MLNRPVAEQGTQCSSLWRPPTRNGGISKELETLGRLLVDRWHTSSLTCVMLIAYDTPEDDYSEYELSVG